MASITPAVDTNTFVLSGVCPLLQVFDMPTALAFYRDVIGLSVVRSSPSRPGAGADDVDWVWLRRDMTELMLNTAYDPDAVRPPFPDEARMAAHGDTVLYIGCSEIDAVYRHLLSAGLEVRPPVVTYYGMTQLCLNDPDGYGVCFQWRVS